MAHNRDVETVEETLRRITRGPDPEVLAELLGEGDESTAAEMREARERKRNDGRERRETLRERSSGWTSSSRRTNPGVLTVEVPEIRDKTR